MITWDDVEEREKELFLSAFWIGFDAGQKVERSVMELESMWRLEREVRGNESKDAQSNTMARRSGEDSGRDRPMASEVRATIQSDKGVRKKVSEERLIEIVKKIIKALER